MLGRAAEAQPAMTQRQLRPRAGKVRQGSTGRAGAHLQEGTKAPRDREVVLGRKGGGFSKRVQCCAD